MYSGAVVILIFEVCLLLTIFQIVQCSPNIKRHNICRPFGQKRVYTTIGSRGIVIAKNDNFNYSKLNDSFYRQCSLHIFSCPSCMINLRFKDVDLSCTKNEKDSRELVCNSICIVEPPYSKRSLKCVNGTAKNSSIHYKSLTSQVNIHIVYRHPYSQALVVEYLITRNTQLAEITPEFNSENISFGGYVSTPFFPVSYPDDLTFEQVINCKAPVCLIHLIFIDFLIAEESIVEFYDSDRKRLAISGGMTFRPPVILTSGPVLYIKFFANAGSSIGYRAQYSYIRGNEKNSNLKPNTNCGGFVENKGGAITMMHMVDEFEPNIMFDCIWLFRISRTYHNFKSQQLYIKVITLNHLVETNLDVREGHTSSGRLLQWRNGSHFVYLTAPIDVGYYIRLTGTFNSSSRLEIAYAIFSQSRACSTTNEFSCKNGHCIPNRLHCDGFDHCGDNSDESTECFEYHYGDSEFMDKSWYAYKSNYYFPNNTLYSKRYHILLGCFIGFIMFFIIILLAVYKIATRYHFQTDFHNRLISISQLLLEGIQLEDHSSTAEIGRIHSNYLTDEPPAYDESLPDYEAPPNYEEAIKMYKESMKNVNNNLKTDFVDEESNDDSHIHYMNVNNNEVLSNVQLTENKNLISCLCCSQASYHILALDIAKMNKCCLNKIYSLRMFTINNQY